MRRQLIILVAFFALILATFAPIRATAATQEDENAGIMLTATSGTAFTSLGNYARDLAGITEISGYTTDVTYYELGLVDLPDPGTYDCWLWAGGILFSRTSTSSGSITSGGFLFQGVVVRLANGNWASTDGLASGSIASGYWPVYFRVSGNTFQGATFYGSFENTGDITVQDAANFMSNLRSFLGAVKNLTITGAVVDNLDVDRLNNFETYDADGGGVIDLVEWVQGTALDNCFDDNVSMNDVDCVCGACCSCECICGKWGGAECGKTPDDCDCHKLDETCTCGDYCCLHKCECGAHLPGETHGSHQNGTPGCDETDGEDGCDCHETDDPEEETCTCANYCCKHTCACEKCGDGEHSAHKNDNGECDGTFENCSDCHEEENPEEETCTCANYCCACKCECEKCKAAGSCSGNHKNGDSKCDGVASGSTYCCDCHASGNPENPEETPCTCANYCCYHTCECKRCASLPAASHSQHQNGSPTCNGTTGSGGCSCHQDDFPEGDVPTAARNEKFIENSEFDEHYRRLSDALEQKFGFSIFQKNYGSFQGDAKLPTFQTPRIFDRTGVTIDLNKAAENKTLAMLRGILVAMLWFLTFARIFNSLREVFG